ncbi:EAL domain-containing protein [Sulfuricurvum sp. IAE1]|uniref:EAL domain-containing protein n=1 Tax=Sulfuricurvum sp. IAE1 TaxID=2546102 RepID=UPI00104C5CE2|nr:EAL domain-containing protein [Sulfuricurvum sp. IAE1]TDA69124.1 EAL domain-containing protein [Sulfuricurvum sp. IAE1]
MQNPFPADRVHVHDILKHMPDGMFTLDTNLIIRYANPAFCKLLGFEAGELIGSSVTEHLENLDILSSCIDSINAHGHCNDQETVFKRKDGTNVHISKNVQALYDDQGTIRTIVVSIRDLTHLHELNKELSLSKAELQRYTDDLKGIVDNRTRELTYRLFYDSLTRLPNRTKLIHDTENLEQPYAIVVLNIDRFGEINSFYGHEIGDELLESVAELLDELSKQMSGSTLYKLPVDEYALLITAPPSREELEAFTAYVVEQIAQSNFRIQDHDMNLNATAGIACSNDLTDTRQSVLLRAGMALKLAKKRRRNYIVYDPSLHIKKDYEKNIRWIKRLREAIEEDRIVPYYHPIVNARTLEIEKYEALVRIIEDDGSVVTPFHFLEISKKVKLYYHVTRIMIDKVFEALRQNPGKICSINLSIEDIHNQSMYAYIIDKVRNCAYSPQLIFEILESEGIENYDVVNAFITEVKKYGVKIALDDFGAGYSNFAYISRLDIDYVKIDGSIIRDVDTNRTSQIILDTILDFASKLGVETVAEFVSSEAICHYLQTLPINAMQGYYFAKPAPSMEG